MHFAEIDGGNVVYNSSRVLPSLNEIRAERIPPVPNALCDEIMLITMRSLLNYTVYDFSRTKPKAVIIELSHSGTVCTVGEELNFKNFAAYCKECGVPVILAPVMSRARVYASMIGIPEYAILVYDMTIEMTIVKVMGALGANLSADAYFNKDFAFEKIAFPSV
ncbi:MAG: hypothetical protein K2N50_01455 [Clostridia bacterium]|nr:hypothetical protein [Clostridia bacterium]